MKCKQNVFFSKRLEQIFIWSNFISKGIIASSTMPLMRSKELTFYGQMLLQWDANVTL
jgi:hypothetical protein